MTDALPPSARAILRAYREAHEIPRDVQTRVADALRLPGASRRRNHVRPMIGVGVVAASLLLGIALRPIGDAWVRDRTRPASEAARDELQRDAPQGMARERNPDESPIAGDLRDEDTAKGALPNAIRRPPNAADAALVRDPSERDTALPPDVSDERGTPSGRSSDPQETPDWGRASDSEEAAASEPKPSGHASGLGEERRVVELAWSALATSDLERAAILVEEHAREFPQGALTPEREAIAALLSCAHERSESATATAFMRRYPGSPLAARVREACHEP